MQWHVKTNTIVVAGISIYKTEYQNPQKGNTSLPSLSLSTLETSVNTTIIENNYTERDHSKILTSTPDVLNDANFTLLQHLILLDLSKGVEHAISHNQVLTIRNVIDVYKDRLAEHGINDPREYRAIRKLVKRFLFDLKIWKGFYKHSPNFSHSTVL